MEDMKEKVSKLSADEESKVSGGVDVARSGSNAIWKPKCPKCGKEMPGGIGVVRVDGTIYGHPYFCKECADSLTDAEKNK